MQNTTPPPDDFLTPAGLSDLLGITTRTLLRWRRNGGGIPYVRLGPHRLGYLRSDVSAWMQGNRFPHRAAESAAKVA